MALSNTAVPYYYGQFRDAVIRGEIPISKLYKKRREHKIDNVAAMLDAFVAYKRNLDAF